MSIDRLIQGETVTFDVDGNGNFSATIGELGDVRAKTLAEAEEMAAKVLKKVRNAKPIDVTVLGIAFDVRERHSWGGPYVCRAGAIDFTLRGYADRTRELLVSPTGDKVEKQKIDKGVFGDRVVRRLTAAEHTEYLALEETIAIAKRALEAFTAARLVNWREHFEVGQKGGGR